MDYLEEQKNEIEALESIYYGDIKSDNFQTSIFSR